MVSKKIRNLLLAFVFCIAFSSFGTALVPSSITIGFMGTISPSSYHRYTCGNYNSTHYYAQNDVTRLYEFMSADAAETVNYAVGELTPGRTWQETVFLKGNFLIDTAIILRQSHILVDCRQATLVATVTNTFDVRAGNIDFLGGVWTGSGSSTAIRFYGNVVLNCVVDGAELKNFTGNLIGVINCAYGSSYITIQNCNIHDNSGNYGLSLQGFGQCRIINTTLGNARAGCFVGRDTPSNEFIRCEFYGNGNPDIYLDGGGTGGYNMVRECYFFNPDIGGTINIKCPNNKVYDNTFENISSAAVGIHFFGQYGNAHCDDNDVYNNTFINVVNAMWVGAGADSSGTTSRNLIHDNSFIGCDTVFIFNPFGNTTSITAKNRIYYNKFTDCTDIFTAYSPSSQLVDTIIAYNNFSPSTSGTVIETVGTNTMVYGNVGLADFNVPSPLPIPPP